MARSKRIKNNVAKIETKTLKSNVGNELSQPEKGWKRIDDTDVNIFYSKEEKLSDCLFGTGRHMISSDSFMSFSFFGKNLRIIGTNKWLCDSAEVIIDGEKTNISFPFRVVTGVDLKLINVYEILNLKEGIHTFSIKNTDPESGYYIHVDAIDIDRDGHICADPCSEFHERKGYNFVI